jgi:hypothetical protein
MPPAERVCTAMRACLERPPRMIGATRLDGLSMFVRRLSPQEDKLNVGRLKERHLEAVASYLGALLGRAHRRGALHPPRAPWSERDRAGIVDRAVRMADLHDAAYLELIRHRAR